jgi:uncharacterized damage-inducible protein DinB
MHRRTLNDEQYQTIFAPLSCVHMNTLRTIQLSACLAALSAVTALAQQSDFKSEYLNEFNQTSDHVVQLATAVPADKFGWRPGPGVRSVSEVYVHLATANFLLLGLMGVKLPAEYYPDIKPAADGKPDLKAIFARTKQLEETATNKDQVIQMLKQSIDAVREHFSNATAADLDKPTKFFDRDTTVRGIYLRILAHLNEHYGQSIAYARMNGVVPPWSK